LRKSSVILALLTCIHAVIAVGQVAAPSVPPRVFNALRDTLATEYVNPIPKDSLTRFGTAQDLLASLLDRHTLLFSPAERREFEVETGQSFGGIGARLGVRRDTTVIVNVEPGSPAARARLRPFDRVVSIGGKPVAGLTPDSIIGLIRGPVGTKVRLGLRRGLARSTVEATMVRGQVQVPSVPAGALLPSGVGVVKVAQFGPETTREAVEALDWMVGNGARAAILDLRDNPGGMLEEALGMAQLFLPAGSRLVEVRGRPGSGTQTARTGVAPRYPKLPLAVLINEGSASASEVLAAALQDAGRATVAGRQSFGKGSVQHVADLPGGWAVKLTIAKWYTPNGRGIDRGPQPSGVAIDPFAPHEGGVQPDLILGPDSASALVARAASAAGPAWDSLNLAILDWVEAASDTMTGLTQEFELDRATARGIIDRTVPAGTVPPSADSALVDWVQDAIGRGVVGGRFGVMEEGAWVLLHDPEVRRVAERLKGDSLP